MSKGKERLQLKGINKKGEIVDERAYHMSALENHVKKLMPGLGHIWFEESAEVKGAGLVKGLHYGESGTQVIQTEVVLGVVAPDGKVWTTFSSLPLSAYGLNY